MTQITLICPHCGGNFTLDDSRPLQAYWTCPYCNSRSLMQKSNDTIRLRGIIASQSGKAEPPGEVRQAAAGSASVGEVPQPAAKPAGESEAGIGASSDKPPEQPVKHRSLSEYIAEAEAPAIAKEPEKPGKAADLNQVRPAGPISGPDDQFLHWLTLAESAAQIRDLPSFNSYSRQAIDCKPDDPRLYAWRALLTEEAGGLARAAWATPVWYLLTPKQKAALLAQHFYAFNTAMRFSTPAEGSELAGQIGSHLVRQAVDHLTERAELRCQKHWFGKTFKGRYHRSDLREAADFCDAIRRVDESVCKWGHTQLRHAVQTAAAALPRRLAKRIDRF